MKKSPDPNPLIDRPTFVYGGTSLLREGNHPRTAIGPYAEEAYRMVLWKAFVGARSPCRLTPRHGTSGNFTCNVSSKAFCTWYE